MRATLAPLLLILSLSAGAVSVREARDRVVDGTMKYLNVPYLWGSEHPQTGLDCSAFVRRVFRDAGLPMPRIARDQFQAASAVAPSQVLPGDIVFFSMKKPGSARVDHVGIYVGKGWFVHAGVSHGVRVEPISKAYYADRMVRVMKYPGF